MVRNTDLLLLQARVEQDACADFTRACAAAAAIWPDMQVQRMGWSPAAGKAYGYLALPERTALAASSLGPVLQSFAEALPQGSDARVSRLEREFDVAGASSQAQAFFHYVVEMDPENGWRDELLRWYDTEHMPGLAGVAGCVRATRLLNHDHGPLSLACYDLTSVETLGSPPWLAVRASAWSDRVRPHFTNTLRTMFDIL